MTSKMAWYFRTILIVPLFIVLFLSTRPARACFSMPQNLARPHAEVAAEAKQIFLAEVVSVLPIKSTSKARKPVQYTLKVIQVFMGQVGSTVQLDGEGDLSGIWDTTFSDHTDEGFWKRAKGRMGIQEDCSMVPPHFLIGKRYLILISQAEDSKQFERVDNKNDRWLQFVAKTTGRTPLI